MCLLKRMTLELKAIQVLFKQVSKCSARHLSLSVLYWSKLTRHRRLGARRPWEALACRLQGWQSEGLALGEKPRLRYGPFRYRSSLSWQGYGPVRWRIVEVRKDAAESGCCCRKMRMPRGAFGELSEVNVEQKIVYLWYGSGLSKET